MANNPRFSNVVELIRGKIHASIMKDYPYAPPFYPNNIYFHFRDSMYSTVLLDIGRLYPIAGPIRRIPMR